MTFTVIADNGNSRTVESRAEAEDVKEDMEGLGMDVEIKQAESDGGAEVVETEPAPEPEEYDLPDEPRVDEDPLNYLPGHFIDHIGQNNTPAINRKGYAVLASHYNIGVKAEPVVRASETDFKYAEFKAVAVTENGTEYSGFGSAHVERMDGDDEYLLNELAETRACKRALALATGVGVVSAEEMRGSL